MPATTHPVPTLGLTRRRVVVFRPDGGALSLDVEELERVVIREGLVWLHAPAVLEHARGEPLTEGREVALRHPLVLDLGREPDGRGFLERLLGLVVSRNPRVRIEGLGGAER